MAKMASVRSVKTIFALGSAANRHFRSFDISQIFTFSVDADVYMELPVLGMIRITMVLEVFAFTTMGDQSCVCLAAWLPACLPASAYICPASKAYAHVSL